MTAPATHGARQRSVPISTVLNFAPHGPVLGAGTVLLRAVGPRRLQTLAGEEARVLTLLSAAYCRTVAPSVLGDIERAAKAWREGDDCLAYIHFAHTRLGELKNSFRAAQRLVLAEAFLNSGRSPATEFDGWKAAGSHLDALEQEYNPHEPRVPAGSGRTSGEWTRDGGGSAHSPLELIADMFVDQAVEQIQAAGTRPVRWYFSQKEVADYAEEVFVDNGLQNIEIIFEPWSGSEK